MTKVIDLGHRRQAVVQAKRERETEWQLESELEHKIDAAHYEYEDQLKRARLQREKYAAAMAQKRAARNDVGST